MAPCAFGHRIHRCPGQQLARVEMRIGFHTLPDRYPGPRPATPPERVLIRPPMSPGPVAGPTRPAQTTEMIDFGPAARVLAQVVCGVGDDRLGAPTPCPAYSVADLLDHVAGLTVAFTAAARKQALGGAPSADGSHLPAGWRERITDDLAELAAAWREPAAYEGTTTAGPIEMPAPVAALDEVVVHGWDIARATGQRYGADPSAVAAAAAWVAGSTVPDGVGEGPFGPAVPVADGAPELDRLVGLTGRDPGWRPA